MGWCKKRENKKGYKNEQKQDNGLWMKELHGDHLVEENAALGPNP